jgi:hypothetical protein
MTSTNNYGRGLSRRICHYCGRHGNTRDHIVAKHWYQKNIRKVPQVIAALNKVWACEDCNGDKGFKRTDCECEICVRAWELMAPYILPRVKRDIPMITVDKLVGDRGFVVQGEVVETTGRARVSRIRPDQGDSDERTA